MTSNRVPTSSIEGIEFSEDEKTALKIHIIEKMQGLNIASAMSLGLFFNNIEISSFGKLPYTIENMSKWNHWIQLQKVLCIEKIRANASKPPSVIYDKLTDFFTILRSLTLLDQTDTTIHSITQKVADLIAENPTH